MSSTPNTSFESDAKISIDKEFPFALHNVSGQGHDRQRALFLRAKIATQAKHPKGKEKKAYETCSTSVYQNRVSRKSIYGDCLLLKI
jgi:hypothetical protein